MSKIQRKVDQNIDIPSITNAPPLVQGTSSGANHAMGHLKVGANNQSYMSLGHYQENHPPKGFSIHINPDPPDDAIVAEVHRIEIDESNYELMLIVANYGDVGISAEINQL